MMNFNKLIVLRFLIPKEFIALRRFCKINIEGEQTEVTSNQLVNKYATSPTRILYPGMPYEPTTLEGSIAYMKSNEYRKVYQDKPVWFYFRQNFKGQFAPAKIRKTCVVKNKLRGKNACPVCRDNYLILSYKNIELLKQFIDPLSGDPYPAKLTGLCLKQNTALLFNVEIAYQLGILEKRLPFRLYDYDEFYEEIPAEIEVLKTSLNPHEVVLPSAARMYEIEEEFVDLTPPPVPNRYKVEEQEYLAKRAKKMEALRIAKCAK